MPTKQDLKWPGLLRNEHFWCRSLPWRRHLKGLLCGPHASRRSRRATTPKSGKISILDFQRDGKGTAKGRQRDGSAWQKRRISSQGKRTISRQGNGRFAVLLLRPPLICPCPSGRTGAGPGSARQIETREKSHICNLI